MKKLNQVISVNLALLMLLGAIHPVAAAIERPVPAAENMEQTEYDGLTEEAEGGRELRVMGELDAVELAALPYINYQEAVDVLTATDLLMDRFEPDQALTRAMAAQVICRLVLGPTTADALSVSQAIFTDIPADHPYAGYIAFCVQYGMISGYADGTFCPDSALTGYAFFKLLLGVLGYDAETEGYVGQNWSINVAKRALNIGLTAGLKGDINGTKAVQQEEACLYVLNTLKARPVRYAKKISVTVGEAEVDLSGILEADPNYTSYADKLFGRDSRALTWTYRTTAYGLREITYVFAGKTIGTYLTDFQDTDITEEPDFDKILIQAAEAGLLKYFRPEEWYAGERMTRLDVAKLCAGFLEAQSVIDMDDYFPEDVPFTDTNLLTDTEKQVVIAVAEVGIIDGYADGSFKPDTLLNRAAVTKVLCNMLLGPETASRLTADTAPFVDVSAGHVFAGYIAYCKEEGIVYGDEENTFTPAAYMTEKAALEWFLRAMEIYVPTTILGTFSNFSWTLDKNLCLTISGSGAMPDCSRAPWLTYRDSIQEVVIQDGITSVGKGAFASCPLSAAEIPESITEICSRAFFHTDLAEINLGYEVASIAADAFDGCPDVFLIRGFEDSFAAQYAAEQGIRFEAVPFAEVTAVVDEHEVCISDSALPSSTYLLLAVFDTSGKMHGVAYGRKDADGILHFEMQDVKPDMMLRLVFLNGEHMPSNSARDCGVSEGV